MRWVFLVPIYRWWNASSETFSKLLKVTQLATELRCKHKSDSKSCVLKRYPQEKCLVKLFHALQGTAGGVSPLLSKHLWCLVIEQRGQCHVGCAWHRQFPAHRWKTLVALQSYGIGTGDVWVRPWVSPPRPSSLLSLCSLFNRSSQSFQPCSIHSFDQRESQKERSPLLLIWCRQGRKCPNISCHSHL